MKVMAGPDAGTVEAIKETFDETVFIPLMELALSQFTGQSYNTARSWTPFNQVFTAPVSTLTSKDKDGKYIIDSSDDTDYKIELSVSTLAKYFKFEYQDATDVSDLIRKALDAESVDEFDKIVEEDTSNILRKIGEKRLSDGEFGVKHDIVQNSWGGNTPSAYGVADSDINSKRQDLKKQFSYHLVDRLSGKPISESNYQEIRIKEWNNSKIAYSEIFEKPNRNLDNRLQGLGRIHTRPNARENALEAVESFWKIRDEVRSELMLYAPELFQAAIQNNTGAKFTSIMGRQRIEPIIESMSESINSLYDTLDGLNLETESLLQGLSTVSGSNALTPYTPYGNRTEDWAGLGMRVVSQLAAKGDFDYVVWLPGYIQIQRWGSSGEGPAKFYDNVLPKIAEKSVRRFDNKAKIKPINVLNIHNDVKAGAFQALGFKVSDKMKKFFEENNATMFTLDTDFAADVPAEAKESPINIINALKFADQAAIPTNVEFKEKLTDMLHNDPNRQAIIDKYGLTLEKVRMG